MKRERKSASSDMRKRAGKEKGMNRNKKKTKKILFYTCIVVIILAFLGAGTAFGIWYGIAKKADPITKDMMNLRTMQTSYVYNKDGKQVAKLTSAGNIDRKIISIKHDDLKNMKNAIVAIEDERFWSHNGFDLYGFMRAAVKKVTSPGNQEGASTITMQLVKGITGKQDYSYERKFQEQYQAMQLEKLITKDQVLEYYLNLISFGWNYYGVEAAARGYFGVHAEELTIAQSACLASIPKWPAHFAPVNKEGKANNLARQKDVLNLMLQNKLITKQEYEEAVNEKIVFKKPKSNYHETVRSYFVDQVIRDVYKDLDAKKYTKDAATNLIYGGGLKIYTTMDSAVQKQMDSVFKNPAYFPNQPVNGKKPQGAMTIIDPKNGQLRAVYGGYGKKTGNLVLDRSSMIERQPGSTIKPIAVYGPAIDRKLTNAAEIFDDKPVFLNPATPHVPFPTNAGGGYSGPVTLRTAIIRSINVVAGLVYTRIGGEIPLEYLKKVDIDRDQVGVSVAMGGLTRGVSPRQMAAAYAPFANRGNFSAPITYTKIVDRSNTVLIDKLNDSAVGQKKRSVYNENTAYIMTDIMKGVLISGTGAGYGNINGGAIESAGKTGTTSSTKDKWFVGYTPYYVGAVWYGYDIASEMYDSGQALKIWRAVMGPIHTKKAPAKFERPKEENLVSKMICSHTGLLATKACIELGSAQTTLFLPGSFPTTSCSYHVMVKLCKESYDLGQLKLAGPGCTVLEKAFVKDKAPKQVCNGVHSVVPTQAPTPPPYNRTPTPPPILTPPPVTPPPETTPEE